MPPISNSTSQFGLVSPAGNSFGVTLVTCGLGIRFDLAVVACFFGCGAGRFCLVGISNGACLLVTGLELTVGSAGHSSRSTRFGTGLVAASLVGST